ncbi:hypothetical protein HMPREF0083_01751 [Aneurinibacillus aneurinilyticus ATCC 12856]|uniref:Uncharacterized protein n=1 Tax=Aneurinibacillus aneurinilyticus ATCC 12856 TaxID=649747 RepID=U1YDG2_ANEAE|nr:hypothetical protein HMPREF0083_01751 [Aneurinibacillus aneurinilyticus ATCC 12856]
MWISMPILIIKKKSEKLASLLIAKNRLPIRVRHAVIRSNRRTEDNPNHTFTEMRDEPV